MKQPPTKAGGLADGTRGGCVFNRIYDGNKFFADAVTIFLDNVLRRSKFQSGDCATFPKSFLVSLSFVEVFMSVVVPLSTIAHGRSGDKGNHANIAVIAYTDAGFDWLKGHLTADRVAAYFASLGTSRVERFEAANVRGFNFMLYDALAGGASRSLRSDTQGKTYALALLQMPVELPDESDVDSFHRSISTKVS